MVSNPLILKTYNPIIPPQKIILITGLQKQQEIKDTAIVHKINLHESYLLHEIQVADSQY